MKEFDHYFDVNKELWNQRALVHKDSDFYNLAAFRQGDLSLNKIELDQIGNVKGKSLLHLQCHFGMDTLSWSRLGAKCTGVDLSDEAIRIAKELNEELHLDATFINSNIYDLKDKLDEKFDIVYTSYGVLGWLPELDKWASLIAHFLKPGGTFFIAEFHPVVWMFDNYFETIKYPYHNARVIMEETTGTYADRYSTIQQTAYGWNHGFEELFMSLLNHGLIIESFREFSYSPYNCFDHTIKGSDGFYRISGLEDMIPMVFSLKAKKK